MPNRNVLIICSVAYSLINFRKDFIEALLANGYRVWCAAPDYAESIRNEVEGLGAQTVDFNLQRKGLDPLKDLKSIDELRDIMLRLEIDFVFAYTIKPVIYGSFAARRAQLKTFSLITGLGFTFSGVSLKSKLLGHVSKILYRRALRHDNIAIFQNKDDQQLFVEKKILPRNRESFVVNGSGINLDRFRSKTEAEYQTGDCVNFILIGRLMVEKGIALYLDAASHFHQKGIKANFHVVGGPPDNMQAMEERLKTLHDQGVIVHHGVQKDVRPYLYQAGIFVLPTYYREGVPRSILEALAIGMPIITTDTPGCKETVIEGENGFLLAPKTLQPLIDAMAYFIGSPEKISTMGKRSRTLAENKFDVHLINTDLLEIIKKNLA
ncbi:MAG: glycosyltransferase family 4 protein [Flavobacteriaceae bacterium]|nr:glycosyltransferase family 4 protein [Flavobacteriaceae bacterium]